MANSCNVAPIRTELYGSNAITVFSSGLDPVMIARDVATLKSAQGDHRAFFVMDMGGVEAAIDAWHLNLPRVEAFYSMSCNSDPVLLQVLADAGLGFSCPTRQHVDLALELVDSDRLMFSNPCLTRSAVRHAADTGVSLLTFDSEDELLKINMLHPEARLLLRVRVADSEQYKNISLPQFGCDPSVTAPALLMTAAEFGIPVVGISIDSVSSHCCESAMSLTRTLFDYGIACGHPMSMIDIGDGFPPLTEDHTGLAFAQMAARINASLEMFFPMEQFGYMHVTSQTSRFFATPAFTLVTNVISSTPCDACLVTEDEFDEGSPAFIYRTNEGLFSSFACCLVDEPPVCRPLFERPEDAHSSLQTFARMLGPSSRDDAVDVVCPLLRIRPLEVGEWLVFPHMGAYSINSLDSPTRPIVYYFAGNSNWTSMQDRVLNRATSPDRHSVNSGCSSTDSVGEQFDEITSDLDMSPFD